MGFLVRIAEARLYPSRQPEVHLHLQNQQKHPLRIFRLGYKRYASGHTVELITKKRDRAVMGLAANPGTDVLPDMFDRRYHIPQQFGELNP